MGLVLFILALAFCSGGLFPAKTVAAVVQRLAGIGVFQKKGASLNPGVLFWFGTTQVSSKLGMNNSLESCVVVVVG